MARRIIRTDEADTVVESPVAGTGALLPITQIVTLIFRIFEVLLVLRLLLRLLAASAGNGLVGAIYAITNPFVAPFSGIIPNTVFGANVIEWSTVIALIVLALIAWIIVYVIDSLL